MGEVWRFAEADLEGQGEVGGSLDGLSDPVSFGCHEEGGKIEEVGFGRGELKVRDERIDEGEGFATG